MAQKLLDGTAAPVRIGVTDPARGNTLTPDWESWFHRLPATLNAIPSVLNLVELDEQGASIAATDFANGVLLAGTYRISYHARISRAATTSSSLIVTFSWTEGGVVQSVAGAAMVGNTTTTIQNDMITIRSDAGTAVTYATTYASVGATSMQYSLDLSLEVIRTRVST